MKQLLITLLVLGLITPAYARNVVIFPDVNTGATTVDGLVGEVLTGLTWGDIRTRPGNSATPLTADNHCARWQDNTTNTWQNLSRGIFNFDTSVLSSSATVSSSTFSVVGVASNNGSGSNSPKIGMYTSNSASNNNLVGADFSTVGTTIQSSNSIAIANWAAAPNRFTLNATGVANITTTGVSKFATREATYDAGSTTPTWVADGTQTYFECYYAEQAGSQPALSIDYTLAASSTGAVINISNNLIIFE